MICLVKPWNDKSPMEKKIFKGLAKFYADEEKFRCLLDLHLITTIPQLLIARPVELNVTLLSAKNVLAAMY